MTTINNAIQGMNEVARQASILAIGLQNAAPPGTSQQSVQYLLDVAAQLTKSGLEIEKLVQGSSKELQEKALPLIREVVVQEEELRKKNAMENKFRFVRERLQAVFSEMEQELQNLEEHTEKKTKKKELLEDEVAVYVYLYNAHGAVLSNWQNLLTPKVFYEYSVNRPIYKEKTEIQTLLRSKSNKTQHAYLTVAIKASHVVPFEAKDNLGNQLIKIKEGSLSIEKLLSFTFNEQDYVLNTKGELVKKEK